MTEEQIFADAIQLPVEQRDAFVQRSCAGDAELRKRVEQLLEAHDSPDSLLEVAARLDSTTDAVAAGRHPVIGNYKLLHKLGEGGFGVVYMAEQMQPVRRKVALKIVILAAASPVGEIKFWRMPSGEAAGSLEMDKGLRRIHFGPDGNRLYWSSMDGDVGYLQAAPIQSLLE